MKNDPQRKRLVIDLPLMMHEEIKQAAKKRNTTMVSLVFHKLMELILQERNYDGYVPPADKK